MPTVVRLNIVQAAKGSYEVHCEDRSGAPSVHGSIEEALRFYGDEIPVDYCRFADVTYGGVHLGTTSVKDLAKQAAVLANRLVATCAAVAESAESIAGARARQSRGTERLHSPSVGAARTSKA